MANINSATPAMAVVADGKVRPVPGRRVIRLEPVKVAGLDDRSRRVDEQQAA